MPKHARFEGLIAATHTPFTPSGDLNLAAVERQAQHLIDKKLLAAFVCGSTGEAHSLTIDERLAMAQRWAQVVRGTPLKLVVHVGHNSLPDARRLAAQAQEQGAHAIAALAPNYFKPAGTAELVDFCAQVAAAAPGLPFYFYDIPSMTGVNVPMDEFMTLAHQRIPTLAGLKFTNADLAMLLSLLRQSSGKYEVLYGFDELMLPALSLGARGAVGSGFNFAAPIYHRMIAAFARNDLAVARDEQWRSIQYIRVLASAGYFRAAKSVMSMLGIDCGPVRLPIRPLTPEQSSDLRHRLDQLGFFDWI